MSLYPFHPELGRELARLRAQELQRRADAWRLRRSVACQRHRGGRRWRRLEAEVGWWLVALGLRLARGDLARQPEPLVRPGSGYGCRS